MRCILTDFAKDSACFARRARKTHHCRTIGGHTRGWDSGELPPDHTPTINPGDPYVEYVGEAPAYQSGERYCAACARDAGLAFVIPSPATRRG